MLELIPFSAPTYWLNYTAVSATTMGPTMGDVALAIKPYLDYVEQNREFFERAKREVPLKFDGSFQTVPDDLAEQFFKLIPIWTGGFIDWGEKLAQRADEFFADGAHFTAANLYRRSASLLAIAEWSMQHGPDKKGLFDRSRLLGMRAMQLSGANFEAVRIPYKDTFLHGLFWPAGKPGEKRPVAVCFNGMHSYMEWFWQNGLVDELLKRGISVLTFDCPGSGYARFHQGLHLNPKTETYAKAAVDWLESRSDVDFSNLVSFGCSFGGYRTLRAASFEKRFKACVAWGAFYEWPQARQKREGKPLTAPVGLSGLSRETMFWFNGVTNEKDFVELRSQFSLEGIIDKLECDLVIFHGSSDTQVTLQQAKDAFNGAVNARSKELIVYTPEDGGDQHCHLDNLPTALGHMADKVAALVGGNMAPVRS